MPVCKFPFQPLPYYDASTKKVFEIIYQPKIPIFIKVSSILYPYKIEPYVDSGATRNLFPADILDSIGVLLENKRKTKHLGIGGHILNSYTRDAEILIDRYNHTEIDFSREHKPPLVGVEGFFSFFNYVHFDMDNHQLELKYSL